MKKNIKSELIILLIIIPTCIFLGISIANKSEGTWPSYSVNSLAKNGYSVIYESLQRLDMNVKRGYRSIMQEDIDTCQVVVGSEVIEEIEDLEQWVSDGGTLIYIGIEESHQVEEKVKPIGKGKWIELGSAKQLTNEYLLENTEVAYELYEILADYGTGKEIIFNEYYLDGGKHLNLWDVTPNFIRIALVELALCVILYLWYKGKRFGKVVMLAEETERIENEYVYAVASLYKKANAWELALSSYYKELLQKINALTRREEDLLEAWEKEKLPELEIAKKVSEYMKALSNNQAYLSAKKKKSSKKEIKHILNMMEHLMKIIDQRREQYWKF